MSEELTQDYLRHRLVYYPETGRVYWRTHQKSHLVGKDVGYLSAEGYIRISLGSKEYYLARLIFLYMTGYLPPRELQVDHKNHITSDNRWCNLRLCTASQNRQNTRTLKDTSTGIKGLCRSGVSSYRAKITTKGETICKILPYSPATEDSVKQQLIDWLIFHRNRLHGEFVNRD